MVLSARAMASKFGVRGTLRVQFSPERVYTMSLNDTSPQP